MITHSFFGEKVQCEGAPPLETITAAVQKGVAMTGEPPQYEEMLNVFSKLFAVWSDPHYPLRVQATQEMKERSGLGAEMVDVIFEKFPQLVDPAVVALKMQREFGSEDALSRPFRKEGTPFSHMVRPAGTVLHIAPGNTFLGSIDSLINGIITLNVNFMKMSDADTSFPLLFLKSIEECDEHGVVSGRLAILWWKGGDAPIENVFKQQMDRIIFWGGAIALASWQKDLGTKTLLFPHGPKVSFGVVSQASLRGSDLRNITDRIAFDICMWEQKACNAPQTIFVEELASEGGERLIESLSASLDGMTRLFPPPPRSRDERVELLKATELAIAGNCVNEKNEVHAPHPEWRIIAKYVGDNELVYSPLNRTVYLKTFTEGPDFYRSLGRNAFYLQTVGYSLSADEIERYAFGMATAGVTRLCPFGAMTLPEPGTPHDGKYLLHDLAKVTVIEHLTEEQNT